ncbi:MAG: hypothetical protein PHI73_05480 [Patescibacteria group bacterium]|nr:hypothetical protein [Patescibacteria group bacterium]
MRPKNPSHLTNYAIIFGLAFIFFFVLQYNQTLADPDSFYHAKMALLTEDHGIIKTFPWLSDFTVLGKAYADQHFLYHVFLIPFVSWLHPIAGLKLATVVLASLFVLAFYWLLRRLRVKYAIGFSLLLLLMNPLVFRLSLAKAPSFSLILLTIGIYFIVSRNWKSLLVLSFIYVWAYGGFAVILLTSGLYLLVDVFANLIKKTFNPGPGQPSVIKMLFLRSSWTPLLSSLTGVILGVIINPYFPQNLGYYRYQLFEIGMKNYQQIVRVGGEWYSYAPTSLISDSVFLSIATLIALAVFIYYHKRQTRREVFFLVLAALFFLLTMKSRRYVEYYVPLGCLFSFTVLGAWLKELKFRSYWERFLDLKPRKKILIALVGVYFFVTIPTIIVRGFFLERKDLVNGIPYTKFQEASEWLIDHSQRGDIVFHSSWDEFPILFYHNDVNNYIGGLDLTFNYLYNKDLYQKWVDITTGSMRNNLAETIRNDFHAKYVLVSQNHTAMKNNIRNDGRLEQVYEDSEAVIFKVPCCLTTP